MPRIVNDQTAGATLTNSTAETVLKSHSFAANFFQVGNSYHFQSEVRVPATNSTDTLVLRARLGGTTLTGTVIALTPTIDVVNGDSAVIQGEFTCTAIGAAGTVNARATTTGPDAASIATGSGQSTAVASLDTTAALLLEITGQWSVAAAGNQTAAENLVIDETVG
jgi:hypothetical protein